MEKKVSIPVCGFQHSLIMADFLMPEAVLYPEKIVIQALAPPKAPSFSCIFPSYLSFLLKYSLTSILYIEKAPLVLINNAFAKKKECGRATH